MLKQYRDSASYGTLNNRCIPSNTTASTDNSKFNLETIGKIYVDKIETAENHRRILEASKGRGRARGKDNNQKKDKACESAECSSCSL